MRPMLRVRVIMSKTISDRRRARASAVVRRLWATLTKFWPSSTLIATWELKLYLSGYPHKDECDLFGKYVLPQLNHGPLAI